jgi:predicted peptidase
LETDKMPQQRRFYIKFLVSMTLICAAGLPSGLAISAESRPRLQREEYHSNFLQADRKYWMYLPEGYHRDKRKWPVIMFLHGGGERGDQLELVLRHGPIMEVVLKQRNLPFIIIAPQMPELSEEAQLRREERRKLQREEEPGSSRKPLRRETTSKEPRWGRLGPVEGWHNLEDDLLLMLDRATNEYRGDVDRVYLTGLSYGGFGTWNMAMHHPDRFAAVAPICGAGPPDLAGKIGQLPVWLFQGGRDTVVRPEWTLATADALDLAGGNVRVTVHEDLSHDSWTRVYEGKDLYDWFLAHRRTERE